MGRVRASAGSKAAVAVLLPLCAACPAGAELTSVTDPFGGLSNAEVSDTGDDKGDATDGFEVTGPLDDGATSVDPTDDESSTTKPDDSDADGSTTLPPPVVCGDGVIDEDEQCDGEDLGGEDCVSQGFVSGALACKMDCTFDTAACASNECGNGLVEDPEACDGMDLAGADCQSQGFSQGALGCTGECTFDTGGCSNPACGNEVIENGEVCDGENLGGQTCVSQGNPGGGALVCLGNCSGYDTSGCACFDEDIGNATGPSVASGDTTGDDDDIDASCGGAGGSDRVISFTAPAAGTYTFDTFGSAYDTKLSLWSDCSTEISCNDDFGGVQSQLTLDMGAGQNVLVVVDGYNAAAGAWVLTITAPGALPCQDQDIGGAIGAAVAAGNTANSDQDLDPSCGLGDALDQTIRFAAPAAAQYTFDTFGSSYDTVLSIWSDCSTELVCNDDAVGFQSQLVRNLGQGEVVLLVVDGYNGAVGDWVLNVSSP